MKKIIIILVAAFGLLLFFSYHLTSVPAGITGDEASFGYNGILLARTLKDENGRKLPVFVLSLGGSDWRQPVTQYFTAVIFKFFGPSLFNLRLTAVIFAIASVIIIFFIGSELLGSVGGIVAAIIMTTTPVFMIQSHMALDNIAPVPFVAFWLLALYLYKKSKKNYWLILSAISLGISYYSYKSMRIFVPVWVILSLVYLSESFITKISKKTFKSIIKPVLTFTISILPFFAIIPYLEFQYAGAVLNNGSLWISNIYNFIYNYLSNFDPSFLFIRGDDILVHSTGFHGMYLLMSLPFFILGLIYSWKKSSFWKLIIISFFLGPLLFGYIGQVHRSSRLLAEIPLYSLISAVGVLSIWRKKTKLIAIILVVLFAINYFDFLHYYFGNYVADTANLFNCFSCQDGAYKILEEDSAKWDLTPYIDHVLSQGQDPTRDFVKTMYFTKSPNVWDGVKKDFQANIVLMTNNSKVTFLTKIDHYGSYYFYINK